MSQVNTVDEVSRPAPDGGRLRAALPYLVAVGAVVVAALVLRWQGRLWICSCGRLRLWVSNAWGSETSQQLFDPYSFTHILHGFLFCWLLWLLLRRVDWHWRLVLAVVGESLWEVIENTQYVINRYRETTASLGYNGDTIVNSIGDITACTLGFLIARKLGWLRSVIVFFAVEAVLLLLIRDSLLLNILLLVYPSEKLKAWQAGH